MEKQVVIIDNGGGFCKAGYSGHAVPRVLMPTVVSETATEEDILDEKNVQFGQEALDNKKESNPIRPIKKGIIEDWDKMVLFWDNLFKNKLKVDPKDVCVFMTEKMLTPKKNREKIAEILFEHFNVPSIYITNSATMTIYAAIKFRGILVDSGYDSTQIIPIRNGYPFASTIKTLNVGGKDVSEYLAYLLEKKGYKDIPDNDIEKIKEKFCYVTLPPEIKEKPEEIYVLPDKSEIKLKEERYRAPSLLFSPGLFEKDFGGIDRKVCEALYAADHFTKTKFNGDVIISGGNTLFDGFSEEFAESLDCASGGFIKGRTKVIADKQRQFLPFLGQSFFTTVSVFKGLCTSKDEYTQYGVSSVHDKCYY